MKNAWKTAFAAGATLLLCLSTGVAAEAATSIHVRGSTTFLPLAQRVAELYMEAHPDVIVAVSGGGTSRGYKSIMDGTADIGLASGTVPGDLKKEIDRRGVKLVSVTAAYIALAPVVHPSNPVNSLSPDQLKDIFTGRVQNWKQLGGRNAPIHVFVGPPTGGLTEAWKTRVIGDDNTYTPKAVVADSAVRLERIKADPSAVTFAAFDALPQGVKTLKIDDIAATTQTVLDGHYPWRTSLYLVTSDKASPAATEFIKFFTAPHKDIQFKGIVSIDNANATGPEHE